MKLRMLPYNPTTRNQAGFGILPVLLIVLVIAALVGVGLLVYQRHKPNGTKNSAATGSTQSTGQQQSTTSKQPQQTAYLDIKEWGVKLPLSGTIKDAYYSVGGNVGTDGLPNTIWLGLTSLNSSGCNASNDDSPSFKPLGAIVRVLPTDHDPGTGKQYIQQDPNGATINGYYYGYASNINNVSCASAATLQAIDAAFATAGKGIIAIQYLTIKEWGVKMPLSSGISDACYVVDNSTRPDASGGTHSIFLRV
jgi:hypothetical protein